MAQINLPSGTSKCLFCGVHAVHILATLNGNKCERLHRLHHLICPSKIITGITGTFAEYMNKTENINKFVKKNAFKFMQFVLCILHGIYAH